MSLGHGAKIVTDGLAFAWDSANNKSTRLVGSNSTGLNIYSDLISGVSLIGSTNLYVSGKTYYTIYGLQYAESSQTPASRQGITPGLNNTTGTKLYNMSRDLGMFVFDEDTNTWVPDSYFNGERINGHCYDTYDGAPAQHATFQADYDNIKNNFSNATFIFIGSHASENVDNDANTRARLQECGFPYDSNVLGRNEFVLVGKPNRPSTWQYVQENVNSGAATMNIGLPLESTLDSGLTFDADTSYLDLPNTIGYTSEVSAFAWFKSKGTPRGGYHIVLGPTTLEISIPAAGALRVGVVTSAGRHVSNHGSGLTDGNWHYIGFTFSGTTKTAYIDGIAVGTQSTSGSLTTTTSTSIGVFGVGDTSYGANGYIGNVYIYDKALTAEEVKQNFAALRGRYGI